MIQLADITKTFGVRTLLEHVTWQIGDGERVGLCGPNGAGKTTLLKMLAGFEEPDSGTVVKPAGLTIGYLPQDGLTHSGRTVFEEASSAFQPLLDMKAEMHDIEHRLGDATVPDADHEAMLHRYSDLQDGFRLADGYRPAAGDVADADTTLPLHLAPAPKGSFAEALHLDNDAVLVAGADGAAPVWPKAS